MTKIEAIKLFGETPAEAARALEVTRQAINNWPDELTQWMEDRVNGAYHRLYGKFPPELATAQAPEGAKA
jgi:DNA-binding XRE family transcriptional regulator